MVKVKCVLCKRPVGGYGHNAEPLAEGVCCEVCNNTRVLPARIRALELI